jgi:DNA repair exonuclease SbcCD ATPase subunit
MLRPEAVVAQKVEDAKLRLQELEDFFREYSKVKAEWTQYSSWRAREDTRAAQLAALDEALAGEPEPGLSEAGLSELVVRLESQQRAENELSISLTSHRSRLPGLEARQAELDSDFSRSSAELSKFSRLSSDPAEAERLRQRVAQMKESRAERLRIEARRSVLLAALGEESALLRRLAKASAEATRLRRASQRVLALKELFHWNALPRDLAEDYLRRAVGGANVLLDQFGANFRVEVGESLGFLVRMKSSASTDGYGQPFPAARLSGGEKVIFSLAFRVMVNSMFAGDVGLLVLDEPTAGLDDGNLSCLDNAFDKLRELSSSSGLQVIVVTHEHRLAQLFDRVHELKPASR